MQLCTLLFWFSVLVGAKTNIKKHVMVHKESNTEPVTNSLEKLDIWSDQHLLYDEGLTKDNNSVDA